MGILSSDGKKTKSPPTRRKRRGRLQSSGPKTGGDGTDLPHLEDEQVTGLENPQSRRPLITRRSPTSAIRNTEAEYPSEIIDPDVLINRIATLGNASNE